MLRESVRPARWLLAPAGCRHPVHRSSVAPRSLRRPSPLPEAEVEGRPSRYGNQGGAGHFARRTRPPITALPTSVAPQLSAERAIGGYSTLVPEADVVGGQPH